MKLLPSLLLPVAATVAACAASPSGPEPVPAPFALESAADGKLYRINRATGETWLVIDDKMTRVMTSNVIMLEVGRKYFIENNRSMKYLGGGKFSEPVADFSALWN